jgi:hypothetical protein
MDSSSETSIHSLFHPTSSLPLALAFRLTVAIGSGHAHMAAGAGGCWRNPSPRGTAPPCHRRATTKLRLRPATKRATEITVVTAKTTISQAPSQVPKCK